MIAPRRKQVEKAVKEDEYKAGSEVANAASLEEWFYEGKEIWILSVPLFRRKPEIAQLC